MWWIFCQKISYEESDSKSDSKTDLKSDNDQIKGQNSSTVENEISLATFLKCIKCLQILHNGLTQQQSVSSKLD